MKILWAPWRMKYIRRFEDKEDNGCIFCRGIQQNNDRENLILYRGKHCFVILNKYPYNSGHLMIAPLRHIGELEKLSEEELNELMRLTVLCVKILKKEYRPSGLNVGVNIGRAAGAGIEDHIHLHIVPRWVGDTNFMPIISETKIMPELPLETYNRLKKYFREK